MSTPLEESLLLIPSKNFIEPNPYGSDYKSDGQLSLPLSELELSKFQMISGGVGDNVPS